MSSLLLRLRYYRRCSVRSRAFFEPRYCRSMRRSRVDHAIYRPATLEPMTRRIAASTRTDEDPMTEDRLPLAELMAKAGDGDFLRSVAEAVVQLLMETDVDGLIGAGRHERTGYRTTYPTDTVTAHSTRGWGSLQLRIPSSSRQLLSAVPGTAADVGEGPGAVISGGLDRWRLDPPRGRSGAGQGLAGISKSTVSKLCKNIHERVNAFLNAPLSATGLPVVRPNMSCSLELK